MRKVAVIGIGQTRVFEHWDKSLKELGGEAILAALKDSGLSSVDAIYVGNMLSGTANQQQQLGPYLADWIGAKYTESLRVEAACSSGSAAFRTAVMAVASGEVDSAVAVGVEKMTDSPGHEITRALATAADADWETAHGVTFVALNALIMQRYMYEYNWKHKDFAPFSINAHINAMNNPNARFHKIISEEDFVNATIISDPINIMDASPIGDGAAAAVIVPLDYVNGMNAIRVSASSASTDSISLHDRSHPLWLTAAEKSAKIAYSQAGITPDDIDLFEVHDAFTIMACLSLEACGFCEPGKAPEIARQGEIKPDGRIPISTLGGLKARGHPVGATGMYQIVELVLQLRGAAGKAQIPNIKTGMAQNIGGSGSNIITHILSKTD